MNGTASMRLRVVSCVISWPAHGAKAFPEYVFLEIVTVLLVRRDLEAAVRVGQLLLEAQELEFVLCSDLFLDRWASRRAEEHALEFCRFRNCR